MRRFILALVLVLVMAVPVLSGEMPDSVPGFGPGYLTINNCTPHTWVGGIAWNADRTDYSDVPELELKGNGTLNIALDPGEYGITYFRPRRVYQQGDQIAVSPPAILDYVDVEVKEDTTTILEFGCE